MTGEEMTMELAGKIALVTGASRGIGRGIALRLAAEGAFVIVHYNTDADAAADAVEQIEKQGGAACPVAADLAQPSGAAHLFQLADAALTRQFGSVKFDILVNNAGIALENPIEAVTADEFDRQMQLNFKSPYFVIQQAIPRLRDGGRVINITSTAVRIARATRMVYACSKAALETLSTHLAPTLGARQITVNAVAPGPTEAGMNPGVNDPVRRRDRASQTALGRLGKPDDIAEIVGFLASARGRWVTGQRIDASGGFRL